MNNMGRLFQYNRFGNTVNNTNKRGNFARNNSKTNEQTTTDKNCPAYSELYPEYVNEASTTTATRNPTNDNTNAMLVTISSTASAVITPATTTTATSKSLELAIKKYQQWSSKLLPTTAATECSNITHLSATSTSTTSSSTTSLASCSAATCSASSGYHSRKLENDREMLVAVTAVKRPKVYDCMKDFLRRKLFQQNAVAVVGEAKQQKQAEEDEEDMVDGKSETEEDVTSDYDEIDILDSSYNADEEDDTTDCASSSSNCSCVADEDETTNEAMHKSMHSTLPRAMQSPLKSALSLNCWQNSSTCADSTDSSCAEDDMEDDVYTEEEAEDSDAGISDCCQLISEKKSPKHKSSKMRYNHNEGDADDDDELLENSWYQPRISSKAALEYLQQTEPGSFLLRRKSRTFELCVRVSSSKVKYFTVISTAEDNYKLKGAKKQFSSLRALVTHHSVMAEQLPVTLILPRDAKWQQQEKMQPASIRYADDFDTFESLQILGILKSLQAKSLEFS